MKLNLQNLNSIAQYQTLLQAHDEINHDPPVYQESYLYLNYQLVPLHNPLIRSYFNYLEEIQRHTLLLNIIRDNCAILIPHDSST